jgi:hypothetical protein
MNENDFAQLKALGERKQSETLFVIDVSHPEDCGTLIESAHFYAQIMPHYYTSRPSLSIRTNPHMMEIDRVDELIALLQKARAIMAGGE